MNLALDPRAPVSQWASVDERVAFEYAKVKHFYNQLGIADRTAIEYFDGGHTINGKGMFDFLRKHLHLSRTVA